MKRVTMGTIVPPTTAEDSAAEFFTNRVFMGMFAPAPRSNGSGPISASGSSASSRGWRMSERGRDQKQLHEGSRGSIFPRERPGPFLRASIESRKGACPDLYPGGPPPVISPGYACGP